MTNKHLMDKAGYKYIGFIGDRQHVLEHIATGVCEIWASNRDHANYGIIYKNTHLEFCRLAEEDEIEKATT